jgi:hypothetical protein
VEEIEGDNSEGSDSDSQSEENETSDTGSNSTDSTDDISSDSSSSSDPDEIIAPPVLAAPLRMPLGIGETIVQLSLTSAASNVPRAVRDGLAEKTRADHIAIIKAVAAAVKPQWRQLPLANAAVKALERLRMARQWRWSTTATHAGSLAGFMKRACEYAPGGQNVDLSESIVWRDYVARVNKRAKIDEEVVRPAVDQGTVFAKVRQTEDPHVLAVLLAWLCAARYDSIAWLHTDDVILLPNAGIRIVFRHGKTIKYTGKYTIVTTIPAEFEDRLRAFLATRSRRKHLFLDAPKPKKKHIAKCTRNMRRESGLGGYEIRRGALQTLQESGVTLKGLLLFSRHKSVKQLKTYLASGREDEDAEMLQASRHLSRMLGAGPSAGPARRQIGRSQLLGPTLTPTTLTGAVLRFLSLILTFMCGPTEATMHGCGPPVATPHTAKGHPDYVPLPYEVAHYDAHRNLGCPSWSEILSTTGSFQRLDPRGWPLHLKTISTADLSQVRALADKRGKGSICELVLRPLTDETFYHPLRGAKLEPPKKMCFFSPEELQKQIDHGLLEQCEGRPDGWVRIRPQMEFVKHRRRIIYHTVSANELPRVTECRLPTLAEIVQLVNEGEYAVCWDFAQYFHAFEYAEAVRKFLGLEFRGKYYRLRRMAMGQTHSCDIAQFVSELILEHILAQIPGTKGVVHIDNGLVVVRSREQGEQVIELLLATAATLGITINDATMLVPSQVVEFVGLNLDFKTSTVSLGPKVLSKAAHLRDYLATVTTAPLPTKLVSCVMGVALFGHAVAREAGDYPAARHYCSMSFYRRLSKDAALAPEVWDRATVIPEQVTADMINWLDEMLRNPQRQRVNDATEADTYVFVDASATAWAVVLCEASQPQRAIVRTGSYPPDVDTERSTQTEPYGLSQALRIIGQIGGTKAIALATDHEPLVSATRKGMSSNARYNRSILDLAATTPRPRILHIAGEMNPADEPSRGMPLAASKLRNAIHMVRNGTNSPALAGGEILPKTSSDHAE